MLKAIKIETAKGEIESTTKEAIDENHEEIIANIQDELVNIEHVKNQIPKIVKLGWRTCQRIKEIDNIEILKQAISTYKFNNL